ncbi:Tm-1-like ATP-binding domain-containing protein, partial [Rhodococcus sp. NPDC059968]|uniref:Tm-1-like ATP-binding domain-containing protein n=1 Tax=Rhodococcus sp. NPDC059968 TaxID=3347017 RepID=UPI00366E9947
AMGSDEGVDVTTVAMLGAFDTKASEFEFLREELVRRGARVLAVDFGVHDRPPAWADVPSSTVADLGGADLKELLRGRDRGAAMRAMANGAAALFRRFAANGDIDGAISLGGTGGTAVAGAAFRELPLGVPKMIVSTAASGYTAPYVGESDLILVPSITDIAGLNSILRGVIEKAAASIVAQSSDGARVPTKSASTIAASMFGVTTPCVDRARGELERRGSEVVVFHMTGTGGRMMERLIREGLIDAALDITTTELADELVGGVFAAGPERLSAAALRGVPQVVSVGALDMVNFGPRDSVPSEFSTRRLYQHNPSVTLMRTTPEETEELGRRLAERLNASIGATTVLIPLRGVSALSVEGAPFADHVADEALFAAIRAGIDPDRVELVELDCDINAPEFADRAVSVLLTNMARSGVPVG